MIVCRVEKKGAENVSLKLEVTSPVVAVDLVRNGTTILGIRKEVVRAVRGEGARVLRSVGLGGPSLVGCFSCDDRGHVQHFCPRRGLWQEGKDLLEDVGDAVRQVIASRNATASLSPWQGLMAPVIVAGVGWG